jgi:hypothetical protein
VVFPERRVAGDDRQSLDLRLSENTSSAFDGRTVSIRFRSRPDSLPLARAI